MNISSPRSRHTGHPRKASLFGLGLLALVPAFLPGTAARAAEDAQKAEDEIGEVVVTATKRREPLQKVPVAITVVDGEKAAQQNLNTINDIAQIVPSLSFRDGASNKDRALFIRGMGTVTTSPGAEPSVSTVVDGVPLDRPGQATFDLLDVERIEVLRGPQGTLFGKNASAGAINIVTRQPTEEFHGYGEIGYFTEGDERRAKAGVSGAIVPGKVKGLLSALTSEYDGNVDNIRTGTTANGYLRNGGRAKLEVTPSDSLRALLTVDYLQSRDTTPNGVLSSTSVTYPDRITANPALAGAVAPVVAWSGNRTIDANINTQVDDQNGGLSGQVDWTVGGHTLTSITAYRWWNNQQYQDNDRISSTLYNQIVDYGELSFDQISQELRVASPKGQRIEYVAGLYYLRAVDEETYQRNTWAAASGVSNYGKASYGTESTNASAFGEATINLTPDFRAIAGLRLIHAEIGYHHQRTASAAAPGISASSSYTSDSSSDLGYSDRFGLQYDVTSNATTYATYSHGYKGPAYNVFFNMVPATQGAVLKPETSNSFEIGVKAKGFDDRARLDVALFHTTFDNYQANFPNLVNGVVVTNLVNAGTVSSRGVEADLSVRPLRNLTLSANLALTDTSIDRTSIVSRNWTLKGKPLPFVPEWKSNVRADYRIPLDDRFVLGLGTNYRWQSRVQYDLSESPDTIQPAFGIWDADLSLTDSDLDWRFGFLVKNILDTHYASYLQSSAATSVPGTAGYVGRWVPRDDGRYFGLTLRKDF